jgi:hypothetical protein
MKIDLHTHILPHDWPDLDAKYGKGGSCSPSAMLNTSGTAAIIRSGL